MGAFISRGLLGHDMESISTPMGNAKHNFWNIMNNIGKNIGRL